MIPAAVPPFRLPARLFAPRIARFVSRRPFQACALHRQAGLLAGVALAVLAGAAHAQAPAKVPAKAPAAAPGVGADGLRPREVYIEADQIADDRDAHVLTAEGHVEARVEGRTLKADKLIYDSTTGAAHAVGNVTLTAADGSTEFSDDAVLDDQFRAGVALGFSARMQDNVTIAAGAAVKRSETVTELRNGIYTACATCKPDGKTRITPLWSIQASRIVQDTAHHVIYYRNAIIRVKGVPIIYFPVLWHPDPTADRHSGFLAPKIGSNGRRGFSVEEPYYWALGPSTDLVTALQVNQKVNPLFEAHYRQKFDNGALDLRVGYTYEGEFDKDGVYTPATNRSYILGSGRLNLDKQWDVGFAAERVTDPALFIRYNVRDYFFANRGIIPNDIDRLVSQIYTTRTDDQSYLSAAVASFQSLRAFGNDANGKPTFEPAQGFPTALPLLEGRWDPKTPILGGRLRLRGSAVVLQRNEDVVSIADPRGLVPLGAQVLTPGLDALLTNNIAGALPDGGSALRYNDYRRASGEAEWRRDFTLAGGLRLEPYAQVRGDFYSVGDPRLVTSVNNQALAQPNDQTIARALGTIGGTASWPFIRATAGSTIIIEPIVQVAVSPRIGPNPNIPNEDSVAFEYDTTNLFSFDRFPGFDRYESGTRVNIGARADVLWGNNHSFNAVLGRTYRAEPDPSFTVDSGLSGRSSDFVGSASISPFTGTSFFVRSRLDAETLEVRNNEAGLDVTLGRLRAGGRYQYNQSGFSVGPTGQTVIGEIEDAVITASYGLTKNFSISVNATRDLKLDVFPVAQVGLVYRNECLRLDVIYTHDETFAASIGSSNSITFRLTLATLGDTASPYRRGSGF